VPPDAVAAGVAVLAVEIEGEVDSVEGEDVALVVGDLAASAVSELPQASAGSSFLDEESAFEGSTGGLAGPHAARQRIEERIHPLMVPSLPRDGASRKTF
jgi:hypothetical protein